MVMDSKKALALVGKGVKETRKYGKMIPTLDGENCDPQVIVPSGKYDDILYLVRAEYDVLRMYVFLDWGGWKPIPASSFDRILYEGFRDEYNELADIVKAVNEDIKRTEM